MAIGRRDRRNTPDPPQEAPHSLIASAARVTLNRQDVWRDFKFRDEEWQSECWRMYDVVGELHFAANYVGSACSRVRIFVANVDEVGRIGDEIDDDDDVQALADTAFGGPDAKAEALRALGVNLTVPGEAFIIGRAKRAGDEEDRWYVTTGSEMRRQGGRIIIDTGNGKEEILPERDIVIRVWTPHPRRMRSADSPTRSALPVLREIEQLTKFVFSQIDSRLAGAGILPIPNNVDFPHGEDQAGGAEGLMQALTDAASASLSGHGSAAALVPILVEMPVEAINAMPDKPIRFESELSNKAKDLRDEALRRLSLAMDMPPEVITGTGDTNHWSAWHIEESAVKIHIEPLMSRICHALTVAYLKPALKTLGKDPKKYAFGFDTAPLTVRPDRLKDTLMLFEQGVVNSEAVLRAGNYNPAIDAPTEEEEAARYIKELMLRDPTLFQVPGIREAAGIKGVDTTVPMAELPPGQPGGDLNAPGPPPPPAPDKAIDNGQTPAVPERPTGTGSNGSGLIAGAVQYVEPPSAALIAADALVMAALEKAGKRLLTREHRSQWQHIPSFELHTKIRVQGQEHVAKLLDGAWDRLPATFDGLGVDTRRMGVALERYCTIMLVRSTPHSRPMLAAVLRDHGLVR